MKVILLICSLVSLAWGQRGATHNAGQPYSVMHPEGPCIQKGEHDFRNDPYDCSVFYRCANSVLHWSKCPPGTVFSPDLIVCVHKGGPWDKCTPTETKNLICDGTSDRLIPHTGNCAQYYDCEAPSRWRWEKNLQECPYPRVFNTENRKCEHYSMVDCGNRTVPLGICEYKDSILWRHRAPCSVSNPSCRDKPDGLNPYPQRHGSSYYIVCVDQRLVYKGRCFAIAEYYDKKLRTCVVIDPMFRVPSN